MSAPPSDSDAEAPARTLLTTPTPFIAAWKAVEEAQAGIDLRVADEEARGIGTAAAVLCILVLLHTAVPEAGGRRTAESESPRLESEQLTFRSFWRTQAITSIESPQSKNVTK